MTGNRTSFQLALLSEVLKEGTSSRWSVEFWPLVRHDGTHFESSKPFMAKISLPLLSQKASLNRSYNSHSLIREQEYAWEMRRWTTNCVVTC